jgi:hypothetical protein
MNFAFTDLADQRHDLDLAHSRHRVTVTRPRTALSARLGHLLMGAGSRLVSERRDVGHTR